MVTILSAQEKNKFIFGGTISGDFGRFNDRIEITPSVHTKIIPKLYFGIGATLAYFKQESTNYAIDNQNMEVRVYNITSKTFYYGVNTFSRFYPFEDKKEVHKNIYMQAEFEYLRGDGTYKNDLGKDKFSTNYNTVFAGIGYKHLLGKKMSLTTSIFFKLNNKANSPYRNPIIRIGFEF